MNILKVAFRHNFPFLSHFRKVNVHHERHLLISILPTTCLTLWFYTLFDQTYVCNKQRLWSFPKVDIFLPSELSGQRKYTISQKQCRKRARVTDDKHADMTCTQMRCLGG